METLKDRLARNLATLERIEAVREESRNPAFGENTERLMVAFELAEIERNILDDPGELERFLVRIR